MMGTQMLKTEDLLNTLKMMKAAKCIWAFTFAFGTILGTICMLPLIITLAILKTFFNVLRGK